MMCPFLFMNSCPSVPSFCLSSCERCWRPARVGFGHADILVADMRLVEDVMYQKNAGHGLRYGPIVCEVWVHVGDYRRDGVGENAVQMSDVAAVVVVVDMFVCDGENIARGVVVLAQEMV